MTLQRHLSELIISNFAFPAKIMPHSLYLLLVSFGVTYSSQSNNTQILSVTCTSWEWSWSSLAKTMPWT